MTALAAPAAAGVQEVAANASLLLLVGGLAMLAFIAVLVLLQSLLPDRKGKAAALAGAGRGRELRPLSGYRKPASAAAGGAPPLVRPRHAGAGLLIDRAMDRSVGMGLGEPRLLRVMEGLAIVRMYECRGCVGEQPDRRGACRSEATDLGEVFRVVYGRPVQVEETLCRRRGDAACEFEVRH